ncbi:MAG: hypothetical protein WCF68_08055 [Terriglobales bacterium]
MHTFLRNCCNQRFHPEARHRANACYRDIPPLIALPCDLVNRCPVGGLEELLAVFAVKKIAHGLLPRRVGFFISFEDVGWRVAAGAGFNLFGLAAGWAAIGESGFIRLQFELF